MASFLASLLSTFQNQNPEAVVGNTSYGPAQARVTRTPVDYSTNLPTAGLFQSESPIHKIASAILPSVFPPGGHITINPSGTSDVGRTTRHEEIHAALDPINQSGQLDALNADNPAFTEAQPNTDIGEKNQEMPAYAGSGELSEVGVNPIISQAYIGKLRDQLFKLDPAMAKMYNKLSGGQ